MTDIKLPLRELDGTHAELWNALRGESKGEMFNASGVMLDDHAALMRTAHDERCFVVAVLIGGRLYEAVTLPASSPEVKRLADRMTVFGPTPAEAERQRRRKERREMSPEQREADVLDMYRDWGCEVVKPMGGAPESKTAHKRVPIA